MRPMICQIVNDDGISAVLFCGNGNSGAVAFDDDIAVKIGAKYRALRIAESAQRRLGRVSVAVVANGNDGVFWHHRTQKRIGGGIFAAVMSDL